MLGLRSRHPSSGPRPTQQNKLNFGRFCTLSEEDLGGFANWNTKLDLIYYISAWSAAEGVQWKQLPRYTEQPETGRERDPKRNGERYGQGLFQGRQR